VLVNTAVSQAKDPVKMAQAFRLGVESGRLAHEAGIMAKQEMAKPSTPVTGQPFTL
jgi:thiazole synthase